MVNKQVSAMNNMDRMLLQEAMVPVDDSVMGSGKRSVRWFYHWRLKMVVGTGSWRSGKTRYRSPLYYVVTNVVFSDLGGLDVEKKCKNLSSDWKIMDNNWEMK